MKTRNQLIWARVSNEIPWKDWWAEILKAFDWPEHLVIERWKASELNWSQIIDSANSFTLFRQPKAILISEAERLTKEFKLLLEAIDRLKKSPHYILFQSEDPCPKDLSLPQWSKLVDSLQQTDDRIGFRWIDAIHAENLTQALQLLETAVQQNQNPFALLQLLTRHFRLGRLIHHAHSQRLREDEITKALKVQAFVIQKWARKKGFSRPLWAAIFNRLLEADLSLKSGSDGLWVLRKLTFDLIQLTSGNEKILFKRTKKPSRPALQLWTAVPSFA